MEIPLREKYLHASVKSMRSTNSNSGSSKTKRRKVSGVKVKPTRERVLVLVDGRRRSWIWRDVT
jgi:hypothetical protein